MAKFEKGKSGNPGGRPKLPADVKALAQEKGKEAIERLIALMASENEQVALRACEALLDRGFGKPLQAIAGEGGGPVVAEIKVVIVDPANP